MVNRTLVDARSARGLTQKDVASRMGISLNHYSFIERGRRTPPPPMWFRLQKVLHLSDAELVRAMRDNAHEMERRKADI